MPARTGQQPGVVLDGEASRFLPDRSELLYRLDESGLQVRSKSVGNVCVLDPERRSVWVSTDPSGTFPIYFAETYVDRERFSGTCYRAANWIYLGQTTGRGKNAPTWAATRSKKDVLALPLTKRFRQLLQAES